MQSERRVRPGRLRRLREELIEEQLGIVETSSVPELLLDELEYALRPPRHERRVPTYGALVSPTSDRATWSAQAGLPVIREATLLDRSDDVRRYADGLASWVLRINDDDLGLVVFDRPAGSERDLVVLAEASGATVVQRHPGGEVRVVGPFGVARWAGVEWQVQPPVDEWLSWASRGVPTETSLVFEQLLRFAVHDLGAAGIGALLVYQPADRAADDRVEHRLAAPLRLNVSRPTDLAPLRHVLSQIDGAAMFDAGGTLEALGVRLSPSAVAEAQVDALLGTRHTSARRYSYDDRSSVVVAVSDDGPTTVFRRGEVVGDSAAAARRRAELEARAERPDR
jgi:hypothetical protein